MAAETHPTGQQVAAETHPTGQQVEGKRGYITHQEIENAIRQIKGNRAR